MPTIWAGLSLIFKRHVIWGMRKDARDCRRYKRDRFKKHESRRRPCEGRELLDSVSSTE